MKISNIVPNYLIPYVAEAQIKKLAALLANKPFVWCIDKQGVWMLYEVATGLLWAKKNELLTLAEGKKRAATLNWGKLKDWRLSSAQEIISFAKAPGNFMSRGQNYRLYEQCNWLCDEGRIDLNARYFGVDRYGSASLICCCKILPHSPEILVRLALERNWKILEGEDQNVDLLALIKNPPPAESLANIDYLACRLPKLEPAIFTDPNKGVWEAWGLSEAEQKQHNLRARNPAQDVQTGYVAIDFGTSSTVVACDNHGKPELMRVGVKDFMKAQQQQDYENPTVLEFVDFQALQAAWQSQAYRPGVLWDQQVRCSHEARHNWRNNESNANVVSSIFAKLKQWALRNDAHQRITDQLHRYEHELAPMAASNPVKGVPLQVGSQDRFDPIELYAWFLGMNINWRQRGLFLHYVMSFPVDYPQANKDNILAAFRRGLQRSLPDTLVRQPVFSEFSVEERASEPAAYAAIALPTLGIAPQAGHGTAYAVFDFGGGTTDFDFGYYRQAYPDEADEGWEAVFERCGSAGDKYLGGENLLDNMAYRTFCHNEATCRSQKIAFTRPPDAAAFAGSELLLEKTQAAVTNTLMLTAKLRPLWEQGQLADTSGVIGLNLINRNGETVKVDLNIPTDALHSYLEQRIEEGIHSFFIAMRKAFGSNLPSQVQVLLAGNASLSAVVEIWFEEVNPDTSNDPTPMQTFLNKVFDANPPQFIIHKPLPANPKDPYQPTGKTGVALGLLRLCPGSSIKTIDHRRAASDEAPFAFYVGGLAMGKFQARLQQGTAYQRWHEVGIPRERVFNLFYTQSPLALTGNLEPSDDKLRKHVLRLAGDTPGHRLYARAIAPQKIELCTAASLQSAEAGEFQNLQTLNLA